MTLRILGSLPEGGIAVEAKQIPQGEMVLTKEQRQQLLEQVMKDDGQQTEAVKVDRTALFDNFEK